MKTRRTEIQTPTRVRERARADARRAEIEVGVLVDDHAGVAAEFEDDLFMPARCFISHPISGDPVKRAT